MEAIQLAGRRVIGFGLGDQPDACTAWPFQGLFGYVVELPVLKAEDEQTDQYMKSLNAALAPCAAMRDVDKVGWQALLTKWNTLHAAIQDLLANPRLVGAWQGYEVAAAEYMCRISAIRVQSDMYQKIGATQCDPKLVPNAPPPPEPPHKRDAGTSELTSTIKTVAVAVAVTAGVVYIIPLVGRLLPARAR